MSFGNRPLISIDKYVTQVGQLQTVSRDGFGDVDSDATSITTIKCLVYQDEDEQDQTNPTITRLVRDRVIIPSSFTVNTHDHLASVVDQFGATVLTKARIGKATRYGHWRYEERFRVYELELDLDG